MTLSADIQKQSLSVQSDLSNLIILGLHALARFFINLGRLLS